ncbi:DNA alkylation repair protein [Bacillus sp. FJAT-42315]|uniref:DNA alkylation repair protein n=1 Tax=Bacillus sp. FJAT-42315 TaxID=2014077 RepID=UPI000BA950BE|nr:DNA alkylation repair protein [Bacillus sp. FJAT-42315]PAQ13148.1 DNA alkylation repair protein [Bacillaceae bacterium SAOS 7]
MTTRYCCPNCQTNRSRFNIIKQVARAVRLDPQTGDVMESMIDPGPLHIAYNGPEKRVQCAVCGLVDDERLFIKFGEK